MSGSNRKFGRNKNRPADKRYLGEKRWVKNKAKAIERHADDVKAQFIDSQAVKLAQIGVAKIPRVRKPKAVKASPQRNSTIRQAFLDCKVVYGKCSHDKLGKCVDSVVSGIERKVGMVRITHHYNLHPKTVAKLQQAGVL